MIQLNRVQKQWVVRDQTHTVLQDITLTIQSGEIFGLIGRSGAGKSTLLRLLNGLESPTQGEVFVHGQAVHGASAATLRTLRHDIGMIFQQFNLIGARTVFENIALPLRIHNVPEKEIQSKVDELLDLTELSDRKHAYPTQLSGGQKQRVAIARALATDCKILLCDEATSALDPETTRNILGLLRTLHKKLHLTIVLVTHEMDVVKQICDRAAVLDKGCLLECSQTLDLFLHPQTDQAKSLIGSHLHHELPEAVHSKLNLTDKVTQHPVLRIFFKEETAAQPLMSELIKHHDVSLNIVWANVESIGQHMLGIMVLSVEANKEKLDMVQAYFLKQGIESEILGYAQY